MSASPVSTKRGVVGGAVTGAKGEVRRIIADGGIRHSEMVSMRIA